MKSAFKITGLAVLLLSLIQLSGCSSTPSEGFKQTKSTNPIKTVYHVDDSNYANEAMRLANLQLSIDPKAKITFVTNSRGVDFLFDGATDIYGRPYIVNIERLMYKGVDFKVCKDTLTSRKIETSRIIPGARVVPSGLAELARLQEAEGYVYFKP